MGQENAPSSLKSPITSWAQGRKKFRGESFLKETGKASRLSKKRPSRWTVRCTSRDIQTVQQLMNKPIIFSFPGLSLLVSIAFQLVLSAAPAITSVTPSFGQPGSVVQILGVNFDTAPAQNTVYFGPTRAEVVAASPSALTVHVPWGAAFAPITVTANGLTASSLFPFVPTFSSTRILEAQSFTPRVNFLTASNPYDTAVGDLDQDGKPDLAVVNRGAHTISVYRNKSAPGGIGVSSFAEKMDLATAAHPHTIAVGDLNGDSKLDLAVAGGGKVAIFRNNSIPDGFTENSFVPKVEFETEVSPSTNPAFVVISDLNGDGKPELIVVNNLPVAGPSTVSIFQNVGSGGALDENSFAPRVDLTAGSNSFALTVVDLDGDAKPDLAVSNSSGNTISVFRNLSTTGALHADSFAEPVDITTGHGPGHTAGDLDRDGRPELIAVNHEDGTLSVLHNTSASGSIAFSERIDFDAGLNPYRVALADLNGDGRLDIVTANTGGDSLSVFRNQEGNSSFAADSLATRVDIATGAGPYSISISDLDLDGKPDLIAPNSGDGTLSIFRNMTADITFVTTIQGTGSISRSPDKQRYTLGDEVTLTARPGPYYTFSEWSDSVATNPRTVVVTSQNSFTAVFTSSFELERRFHPEWDKAYGGLGIDIASAMTSSKDGGYLIAGTSDSQPSGNKSSQALGGSDFWVIKVNAAGTKVWERTFGGSNTDANPDLKSEVISVVQPAPDGGFLLGGWSNSGISGNKTTTNLGLEDGWIIKIDANGEKVWERSYGGTDRDYIAGIAPAHDGGYVVAARSDSPVSGNRTVANLGGPDIWVFKIDEEGNIIWQQAFGGSDSDTAFGVIAARDGGYLVLGNTYSDSYGSEDFYVVKIDVHGNEEWSDWFGGTDHDFLTSASQTDDGGFILAGWSRSDSDGNKSAINHGNYDFWVVRLDVQGTLLWDESYGGELLDHAWAVQMVDSRLFVAGYSASEPSGNKTAPRYGGVDFWLIELDSDGQKLNELALGGSGDDHGLALLQTSDGGLLFAGRSSSAASGSKTASQFGSDDFWVNKLVLTEVPVGTPSVLVNGKFSPSNAFAISDAFSAVVTLQSTLENLFYTLDGSTPTANSTPYTGPFTVSPTVIVRAIAYDSDLIQSAEAAPVQLTYVGPPAITDPPANLAIIAGSDATFSVSAAGGAPLTYQWQKNGIPLVDGSHISGANTPILLVRNAQVADSGVYTVIISNSLGSAPSSQALLSVASPNQAPKFVKGPNQFVFEDFGPRVTPNWAFNIQPGPLGESGQQIEFQIQNNNPTLFAEQPSITPAGTLSYTPAPDASGIAVLTIRLKDNGGTANGGVDTSGPQVCIIGVLPLNDAPRFMISNRVVAAAEDTPFSLSNFITNIRAGPSNESSQKLSFQVASLDPAFFSVQPSITTNGLLKFVPAKNMIGDNLVTVVLEDNGGTMFGGINRSPMEFFLVTITPANDPPSFKIGPNRSVLEDAGPQVFTNWVTNILPGPANEDWQEVTFTVTANNPGLFTPGGQPAVSPNGSLAFTPAPDAFGTAKLDVRARDNGGTASGGSDTSPIQSAQIIIRPVNDVPSFSLSTNLVRVSEDALLQRLTNFALNIRAGPGNEAVQSLSFILTNSNRLLFSTQPALTPSGLLTFMPAANASGTSLVNVVLRDSGGTASGGVNQSVVQPFTIVVTPINDPPVLAPIAAKILLEDGSTNLPFIVTDRDTPIANVIVTATSTNSNILPSPLVVLGESTNRTVRIAPLPNANGTATIRLIASDDQSGKSTNLFAVTVTPVNDIPTFSLLTNFVVTTSTALVTIPDFARNISKGPPDEVSQSVTFDVKTVPTNLFVSKPAISPAGALTFRFSSNATTSASVDVVLQDSGGTANGGINRSLTQNFTIIRKTGTAPTLGVLPDLELEVNSRIDPGPADLRTYVNDPDSTLANIQFRIVNMVALTESFGLSDGQNGAVAGIPAVTIGKDPESGLFKQRPNGAITNNTIHVHPRRDFVGTNVVIIEARDPQGNVSNQKSFMVKVKSSAPPEVRLVKDINQIPDAGKVQWLQNVNGTLFFSAFDISHGQELWSSDGTVEGTKLVKDIWPGSSGSDPGSITSVDGILFFFADDGVNGSALWKSDGTDEGTVLVKDILPGFGRSVQVPLAVGDGTLWFAFDDGVHGVELWKSDGTTAGTLLVKDIQPGINGSNPYNAVHVNGSLFFTVFNGSGLNLWKSDGTAEGTRIVESASGGSLPIQGNLARVNGTLFFTTFGGGSGGELWKTDGTANGTMLVKDVRAEHLVNLNGTLFFWGADGTSGNQLWKSDGTENGTIPVKAVNTPRHTIVLNSTLFFAIDDALPGMELWKSDGTESGTVLVKDITPGVNSGFEAFTSVNGLIYFSMDDGVHGFELWRSDGTEEGTFLVKDILPGSDSSWPFELVNVNGQLFFVAIDNATARAVKLWKSDGTTLGTVPVRDPWPESGNLSSDPFLIAQLSNSVLFTADDGIHGFTLWKTDGTSDGTTPVSDSPFVSIFPRGSVIVNQTLFFQGADHSTGRELWRSDGTAAGTSLVKDINPGPASALGFSNFIDVNGTLFFWADNGFSGKELWKSDGTEGGTVMVKDMSPGSSSAELPFQFFKSDQVINSTLYFIASDGIHGHELWKTDGTDLGTVMVKDIYPNSGSGVFFPRPRSFVRVGSTLFFAANDNVHGFELWKSDGTEEGTVLVMDIFPGASSSDPFGMWNVNGFLFFRANDGVHGEELWTSDGTDSGTALVKDIEPGGDSSWPSGLAILNETFLFSATDNANGHELWKSDGSASGTILVKNIAPEAADSFPDPIASENGILYFSANGSEQRTELWQTDGTTDGTKLITHLGPGRNEPPISELTASSILIANGTLFFTAWRPDIGAELFALDLNSTVSPLGPASLARNKRIISLQSLATPARADLSDIENVSATASLTHPPDLLQIAHRSGKFVVTITTVPGQTYLLEYSDSLTTPPWTPLTSLTGDGSVKVLPDPAPAPNQRFYRVRLLNNR